MTVPRGPSPAWPLPAVTSEPIADLLRRADLLHAMVDACGSPLGVVVPEALVDNAAAFRRVLARHAVDGRIWFACKVNKSPAFLEAAAHAGIGIDASSLSEVRAALGHGIAGPDIGVSGPGKTDRLLLLAIRHGCTISVDSLGELGRVAHLAAAAGGRRARVLVRLSGFTLTTRGRSEPSDRPVVENGRFGVALERAAGLFALLRDERVAPWIELGGFAFHIDNLVARDRVTAFGRVLEVLLAARGHGHPCRQVNAGGGFPVRYVRSPDWAAFHAGYAALLSAGRSPMFRGRSFGVEVVDGRASGRGNFYFHDTPVHGAGFLDELLSGRPAGGDLTVAGLLAEHGLSLTIEPGRSAIDQGGLTLCRVQGCRRSTRGDRLVVCEMNASNLWEQATGSEYTVDPVLLPREPVPAGAAPFTGHLAGNLCMETDILAWRPVALPARPRRGDLLAFVNTAGYQMDFAESPGHLTPLPRKVAVRRSAGGWAWKLDSEFSVGDLADLRTWDHEALDDPGEEVDGG